MIHAEVCLPQPHPAAHVLLVEDDPAIRGAMHRALSQAGLNVSLAPDGDSAAGLLDGHSAFDLLVTDIQMGAGRDGFALATDWRSRAPGRPVLFVCGSGDPRLNDAVASRDTVMPKPFQRAGLVAAVRRLLEEHPRHAA